MAIDPHDFLAVDGLLSDRGARHPRHGARVRADASSRRTSPTGTRRARCPTTSARSSASSACSACTWRATAARARAPTAYGIACRELEAVDSGLRSFVSVQGSLAMYAIHRWGTEEQKEEWLPRMATGEALGCFGLTEPDAGSDPASMRTRAKRDGDDWVLNGSKMWITNGTLADVAVVWAQTDDGIRGFVVPTDTPGLHRHQDPAQAVAARVGDGRAVLRRPAAAGRRGVPRGARPQGPAELPERGALRHPLGRGRRGARVLRGGAGLLARALAVRQAARVVPAHAEEARRDGDRGQQRLARRDADRPAQGRRQARPGAGVATASSATCARRSTSPAARGPCSAAPASRWTTRSCGT